LSESVAELPSSSGVCAAWSASAFNESSWSPPSCLGCSTVSVVILQHKDNRLFTNRIVHKQKCGLLKCQHQRDLSSSSSGACPRRHSRCHEFPPSRSVLSASHYSRQSKIHRSQVGLHSSEPGLPWTTNPLSPVVRWARNAGLESSVMILPRVSMVEM